MLIIIIVITLITIRIQVAHNNNCNNTNNNTNLIIGHSVRVENIHPKVTKTIFKTLKTQHKNITGKDTNSAGKYHYMVFPCPGTGTLFHVTNYKFKLQMHQKYSVKISLINFTWLISKSAPLCPVYVYIYQQYCAMIITIRKELCAVR